MEFTKEYIKECDCKEIQGLKGIIEYGDWYKTKFDEQQYCLTNTDYPLLEKYKNDIWLPTGDQLDDEIIKIIKDNNFRNPYELEYVVEWTWNGYQNESRVAKIKSRGEDSKVEVDDNPLIAKIKLLKELIKENK